jgi:hypothetical protein
MAQGRFDTDAVVDRAATLRLHRTMPAVEGVPTAFRPALGSRRRGAWLATTFAVVAVACRCPFALERRAAPLRDRALSQSL